MFKLKNSQARDWLSRDGRDCLIKVTLMQDIQVSDITELNKLNIKDRLNLGYLLQVEELRRLEVDLNLIFGGPCIQVLRIETLLRLLIQSIILVLVVDTFCLLQRNGGIAHVALNPLQQLLPRFDVLSQFNIDPCVII